MPLDRAALNADARRVVRVVGDELLARVRKRAEGLQSDDPDALHDFRVAVRRLRSWVRAYADAFDDTLRGKDRRRLDGIADATRASRDLEVHIAWVDEFSHARRKRARPGSDWLIARLQARKTRADLALRQVLDDDFERTEDGLRKTFRRYMVTTDQPPDRYSRATAKLVRDRASASRTALAGVTNIGDRAQGHQARIAAKQLRYLLEPLGGVIDGVDDVVSRLTTLQDDFGALHDAQLFGAEIASLRAKVQSSKAKRAARAADANEVPAPDRAENDRAELLLAISRRLHRDEEAAFARCEERWLGDKANPVWAAVETIAVALDDMATQSSAAHRRYLLRDILETPPGRSLDIEIGYLPDAHVVDRVQRVTGDGGRHYFRAVEIDGDTPPAVVDEEISKSVFAALWPLTKGRRVKTHRISVDFEGHCWMLDRIANRGISLASVSLPDARESVAIPEWLEPMIDHDVTDDAEFTLRNLASS